jgi:ketosteroid isomerase-like protein
MADPSNAQLVRAFFANAPDDLVAAVADPAWIRQTREALEPLLTDDFEFVTVQQSVGMPATERGVEGFFTAYREYTETWESLALVPERFVEVGDKVVVEVKLLGITITGRVQLEQAVAAIYSFEDGRIKRIEEFSDIPSAHEAAGSGRA